MVGGTRLGRSVGKAGNVGWVVKARPQARWTRWRSSVATRPPAASQRARRPRADCIGIQPAGASADRTRRVDDTAGLSVSPLPRPAMQGPLRKIVHASLYEAIAVVIVTVAFALFTDHGAGRTSVLAIACSVVALVWNMLFNSLFEAWERRHPAQGRSVPRRIVHAICFEGGLVVTLVPLIAWWLEMSLWQALIADLGLVVFFLGYTFAFNWAFDHVFGLPASAGGGAALRKAP